MIWPTDVLSLETWILLATVLGLIRYYLHRKWSVLKDWNIAHNPPSIMDMGNTLEAFRTKPFTFGLECKKKYGPIYGFYTGTTANIVIHDVEMLRQIFIKEFANFPDREVEAIKLSGKEMNSSLLSTQGQQWKRIRSTMSPMFSSSKLKDMVYLMEWCVDNMVELLDKKQKTTNGTFNAKKLFSRLSLDIVLSSAFSTRVNSQDDTKEEPEISKNAKKLFEMSWFSPLIFLIMMFPPAIKWLEKMDVTAQSRTALNYFTRLTSTIMQQRIQNPHEKNRTDLMQLLLEKLITEEESKKEPEKGMTKTEIMGNSIVMIIAGYESTAITMEFLSYNLAMYPEIQAQVQEEIDQMMKTHGKLDYEGLKSLKLLDMCINETLRLQTPIISNARASIDEITINGFTIPPKTMISIPTFALAHDPEHWEEPNEFKPERMRDMSQIDPMVFQPFGAGPRSCIAMRFALIEIKMAIAKLLYKFDLKPAENTPKPPLELVMPMVSVRSKVEFDLRAVPREAAEKSD